jgi:hypothetical protein
MAVKPWGAVLIFCAVSHETSSWHSFDFLSFLTWLQNNLSFFNIKCHNYNYYKPVCISLCNPELLKDFKWYPYFSHLVQCLSPQIC